MAIIAEVTVQRTILILPVGTPRPNREPLLSFVRQSTRVTVVTSDGVYPTNFVV